MERREFKSRFYFEDKVLVEVDEGVVVKGEIVGIVFTPDKIRYDVQTDRGLLTRTDSAYVKSAEKKLTEVFV